VLSRAGIANPRRLVYLMRQAIDCLKLDLSGLAVLTEAASGPFAVTPVLASLAGARCVTALTADSRYASASEVVTQTRALESLCGVEPAAILTKRSPDLFADADIITNLGFVRPIDRRAVAAMKPTAVVPLMCEAWEVRAEDVDLHACREKGIAYAGTNEDFPGLEIFAYSGWLALKLLFEAGIEMHKARILIVSTDKFGRVIRNRLAENGLKARLVPALSREVVQGCDVIIVADYTRSDPILGPRGDLTGRQLERFAPHVTVVQFAGRVDAEGLSAAGMTVYPEGPLPAHRMAKTLAYLGPRPAVELHAAGLKVGDLLWKRRSRLSHIEKGFLSLLQDAPLSQP
jgi:hypothetical protein